MSGLTAKSIPRYTSIIITSFIDSDLRARLFRSSILSLVETTSRLPVEIIVVDNGEDEYISQMLSIYASSGVVCTYIKNANNLHFGMARNQGIACAKGNYIVIADNDIFYKPGWLEACWKPLELYPEKLIYATPIAYPRSDRYVMDNLDVDGETYKLDMRAGSNCFVIRKNDLDHIGHFQAHRIAGSRWTDAAVKAGYLAAVAPGELVTDLGLHQGYAHNQAIPIERVLRNGQKIQFNTDELAI